MSLQTSKAYAYVVSKGWPHRVTDTQLNIENCPVCEKGGFHFFINYTRDKDGLFDCKVCGETGNLHKLKAYLGDRMENVSSMHDVAMAAGTADPLPNVDECHRRLITEAENPDIESPALDYLVNERGFSMAIIEKYKLGLGKFFSNKNQAEIPGIVIPYFSRGSLVFVKYRSLPPAEKDFGSIRGREAGLFNDDVLAPGVREVIFCEGEPDTLSCLSNGVANVVGVPGANLKKTAWIKRLDDIAPEKIYILYDRDAVGQKAAKELASRIGLDRCYNMFLPETFNDQPIKDANDFWLSGATMEDFKALKDEAKPFPVDGVFTTNEVIEDLKRELQERGTLSPKYDFCWSSLNKVAGGMEDGDLVGIMAEAKIGKTTLAMNQLDYLVERFEEPGMLFCQEMTPKRLIRKWVAFKTDTEDEAITIEVLDRAAVIAANRPADLLFARTSSRKFLDVAETIRQARRRYGIKFVVFDNLQMLVGNLEHATQETSNITKGFKALALELGIVFFLIIQPHRVRDGEIISARNAAGSSAIEKDVDMMVCLHRNREGKITSQEFAQTQFIEVNENFNPAMLCRVDLSRYSSGGTTTLWMEGSKSRVVEFPSSHQKPVIGPSFFEQSAQQIEA